MRIGVVDVDTSHPQNWIPIERELGHEVVGLWDGGAVHSAEYVKKFAHDHNIPTVYPSLEAMVPEVDCAIIHGCDWDTHIAKARPFVEAGKSVLLDKPVAGNIDDIGQIVEWVNKGARVSGGSSLRFCYETRDWLAIPEEERGTPHTVICGCGVDEYNYGIHAYALLSGILGPGIASVRHLSQGVQRRIEVTWENGAAGILAIGKMDGWIPFHADIITNKGVTQFVVDSANLYRALLERVLPYLAGDVAEPPVPIDTLVEPELCALAAKLSWTNGNKAVPMHHLAKASVSYDGAAFANEYAAARGTK
ncbi:MAG: Gfo/Idh/MocA family oxidoreductase [Candidatus Hydrogenedentes bacterium]|nr:Gfo/Idh/MocA family oxidoreductase [Candidatus Hydrogenedentota bacterium]